MRKHAVLKESADDIKRLMLFACENGVYLYLFDSFEDVAACDDIWFDTLYDAQEYCKAEYGVHEPDWEEVSELSGFCFNDDEPVMKRKFDAKS